MSSQGRDVYRRQMREKSLASRAITQPINLEEVTNTVNWPKKEKYTFFSKNIIFKIIYFI